MQYSLLTLSLIFAFVLQMKYIKLLDKFVSILIATTKTKTFPPNLIKYRTLTATATTPALVVSLSMFG